MSETTETFEMMEWLENTRMVETWELAEAFKGFKLPIEDLQGLKPGHIPEGWEIKTIYSDKIFIKRQE